MVYSAFSDTYNTDFQSDQNDSVHLSSNIFIFIFLIVFLLNLQTLCKVFIRYREKKWVRIQYKKRTYEKRDWKMLGAKTEQLRTKKQCASCFIILIIYFLLNCPFPMWIIFAFIADIFFWDFSHTNFLFRFLVWRIFFSKSKSKFIRGKFGFCSDKLWFILVWKKTFIPRIQTITLCVHIGIFYRKSTNI